MNVNTRAGTLALPSDLIDVKALIHAYYSLVPDVSIPEQCVVFGTSGHRGSSLNTAFNEHHILATTQAIVEYRALQGITGPLFIGMDTHALSRPAQTTALEVLVANGVRVMMDSRDGFTPTPSLSHAILAYNRAGHGHASGGTADGHALPGHSDQADGIVVTPSHNPPGDGGFKYNPPHGGPADSDATNWIATRANEIIAAGLVDVKRTDPEGLVETYDFLEHYVADLGNILNMDAIKTAGVRIGADPLGGASVAYWAEIGERY